MRNALALSLVLLAASGSAAEKRPARVDGSPAQVTLIFSSGLPVEQMHQRVATPDAYTCPTPATSSVASIAEALGAELRARGITVELMPAATVDAARALVRSPVLVLMGSTHFGRTDWGLKRVLDERFSALAVAGLAEEARGKALFVLGHAEAKQGGAVLDGVRRALDTTKLPFDRAGTYTTQDDTDQAKRDVRGARLATIGKLAADIAVRLTPSPE